MKLKERTKQSTLNNNIGIEFNFALVVIVITATESFCIHHHGKTVHTQRYNRMLEYIRAIMEAERRTE